VTWGTAVTMPRVRQFSERPFEEIRVKIAALIAAAVAIGCSATGSSSPAGVAGRDQVRDSVQVNGALRLVTRDMPMSQAPVPFTSAPEFGASAGAITIAKSQVGSLCRSAVTGSADTRGRAVGVHIVFTERLTTCTADVRALQYDATITASPGTYDVALVHEANGAVDTIARRSVTVP
jgi:hypothetical protein